MSPKVVHVGRKWIVLQRGPCQQSSNHRSSFSGWPPRVIRAFINPLLNDFSGENNRAVLQIWVPSHNSELFLSNEEDDEIFQQYIKDNIDTIRFNKNGLYLKTPIVYF